MLYKNIFISKSVPSLFYFMVLKYLFVWGVKRVDYPEVQKYWLSWLSKIYLNCIVIINHWYKGRYWAFKITRVYSWLLNTLISWSLLNSICYGSNGCQVIKPQSQLGQRSAVTCRNIKKYIFLSRMHKRPAMTWI